MIWIWYSLGLLVYSALGTIVAALACRFDNSNVKTTGSDIAFTAVIWPLVVVGTVFYYTYRGLFRAVKDGTPMQTWKAYVSRKSS